MKITKITKKLFTLLVSAVLLSLMVVPSMVVPASAVSEEDLMKEFKKISISHYMLTEVENLSETYDVTPAQAEKLLPLLREAQVAFPVDLGPGYANPPGYEYYFGDKMYPYTAQQLDTMMKLISQACDILGFTYEFRNSYMPMHHVDIVFVLRDTNGRVCFEYDGDLIKKLGEVEEDRKEDSSTPYLVGGISVSLLAGLAAATLKLKKKEQE